MSDFSNVFKNLRTSRGYTQEELAKLLNISRSRIGMYETGSRKPDFETLEKIADFFNVDTDYLLGRTSKTTFIPNSSDKATIDALLAKYPALHPIERRKFPMLGSVACGKPIIANEEYDSYVIADANIDADFCLTAKGDSMINARILDGDIVFIKTMSMVDNGEIAAVCVNDDEVTLKRFYYDRDAQIMRLLAENPLYTPLVYVGEELDHVHIVGKVVFFQSMAR